MSFGGWYIDYEEKVMGHMDWGRERVRENAPTRNNKAMEGEDLPKKDKDIVDVTLEEAYNAIVKGLGIIGEAFEDGNRDKPKKEKKKPKKEKK